MITPYTMSRGLGKVPEIPLMLGKYRFDLIYAEVINQVDSDQCMDLIDGFKKKSKSVLFCHPSDGRGSVKSTTSGSRNWFPMKSDIARRLCGMTIGSLFTEPSILIPGKPPFLPIGPKILYLNGKKQMVKI